MGFDWSVHENLLGDLLLEKNDSTAISGQIFLIETLDQFSQRRKMRLEDAHPMHPRAKPFAIDLTLKSYNFQKKVFRA